MILKLFLSGFEKKKECLQRTEKSKVRRIWHNNINFLRVFLSISIFCRRPFSFMCTYLSKLRNKTPSCIIYLYIWRHRMNLSQCRIGGCSHRQLQQLVLWGWQYISPQTGKYSLEERTKREYME